MLRYLTRQKWLSPGLRHRLVNLMARERPAVFQADFFGLRYRGRLDSPIDRSVYYFGCYEPTELEVLEKLARQRSNAVLLDIGANVGHHSLFASLHYGVVHAFEPYPPIVEVLHERISTNSIANVHVHPIGLAETDGQAEYAAPHDDRGGYGSFVNDDPSLERHQLPIRRGDGYLAASGVTRVDVVKIDVEGSEYRVLAGLRGTLAEHRPAILMEYWPENWPVELPEVLPSGYRAWLLRGERTVWGVFGSQVPALLPLSGAWSGCTVLVLPDEWPIPHGIEMR